MSKIIFHQRLNKIDSDFWAGCIAWPRFVLMAAMVTLFAVALFLFSLGLGYGLKLIALFRHKLMPARLSVVSKLK